MGKEPQQGFCSSLERPQSQIAPGRSIGVGKTESGTRGSQCIKGEQHDGEGGATAEGNPGGQRGKGKYPLDNRQGDHSGPQNFYEEDLALEEGMRENQVDGEHGDARGEQPEADRHEYA
jgi:hypothetical protein